jgi:predicted amidohydrolase
MKAQTVKVAAVQAAPVAFDLGRSIERISKFTVEAAQCGADLVAFPYGVRNRLQVACSLA